jgi:hypothetical protein
MPAPPPPRGFTTPLEQNPPCIFFPYLALFFNISIFPNIYDQMFGLTLTTVKVYALLTSVKDFQFNMIFSAAQKIHQSKFKQSIIEMNFQIILLAPFLPDRAKGIFCYFH